MSTNPEALFTSDVEVGGDFARESTPEVPVKPVKPAEAPVEAAEEAIELTDHDEVVDEHGEPDEKPGKSGVSAKDRIRELNKRLRAAEKERDIERGIREGIEKLRGGEIKLPNGATSGNDVNTGAPDPTDTAKYPLGSLDDRYIKDQIAFGIEDGLRSARQRQADQDAQAEAERVATDNLGKAQGIVQKGVSVYEDFEEVVWEAGQRGDYPLSDPTFHAITEAEHSADIIYALASDKAEAARVAKLSPYQQIKYVAEQDAKFAAKRKPKAPQAGSPPAHQARGVSGKFEVDPATEDLGAFKRALFNR